ncbi:MAG: hypothetical protein RLZZ156_1550, partial [Deinococcota bacterium]
LEQMKVTAVPTDTKLEACLTDADAAILVTEWYEYQMAHWAALGKLMKQKVLLDGRNALPINSLLEAGFLYLAVGRN